MNTKQRAIAFGGKPLRAGTPDRIIDISRRNPVTVRPETSISAALEVMAENRIGSVVVTDPGSGAPVGIFTLRDVLCRVSIPRIDIDRPIESVMTRNPVSICRTLSVRDAAKEMARLGLRHLLVTDPDGALTGIVSRTDVYEWMCFSCRSIRKTARATAARPSTDEPAPADWHSVRKYF